MRPAGIGRFAVRLIKASMSESYAMLSAPDAPAAIAMHNSAVNAVSGLIVPGATTIPASPVKITSDITRGLSSAK